MSEAPTFAPRRARFFDLVDKTLQLAPQEVERLERNGFVVSDRLSFEDFSMAYGYLFWKDLPLLITTDSLLQAVHQSYDDLLEQTERLVLKHRLITLLSRCREAVQAIQGRCDPTLAPLLADLDLYLAVPLALLTWPGYPLPIPSTPEQAPYLKLVMEAASIEQVALFGKPRLIDFSLCKPRGHYAKPDMQTYFQAMSWLAQIDFRLVDYDAAGRPTLNLRALATAMLLLEAINTSGQRAAWQELDRLFSALIGRSDNLTLPDLERFLADAGLQSPAAILQHSAPEQVLHWLTSGEYSKQQIASQIQGSHPGVPTVPQPISFLLLGQRFALDSWVLSQVVYDRLVVNGQKVKRTMPSPLDVMAVLGNQRAEEHLQTELERYGYQANLAALREEVARKDDAFWAGTLYHHLLNALRTLHAETTGEQYPPAMRSPAWADKMLHTQLTSWAQMRHDNILYVKRSISETILCEYPSGYVEPYPAFYAQLRSYAALGLALFEGLNSTPADPQAGSEQHLRRQAMDYFRYLGEVAGRLQTLAEKELRQEPLSEEEELWLKQPAALLKAEVYDPVCAPVQINEEWAGWYTKLLPWRRRDQTPACIADVHTDPPGNTGRILHVATGPVALTLFLVTSDQGQTVYAGPALTYYEVQTAHPQRMTDEQWRGLLEKGRYPAAPAWTESFRWSDPPTRERLAPPMPEAKRQRPGAWPGD